jgi:peroxiredoxin
MSLHPNQPAPDFQIMDISGNPVRLSDFKGNKVLLTFYRHVGCPFTNLRFLELQKMDEYFREMGLVVLAIYESSMDNLKRYSAGESFYARIIANAEFDLYTLYDIERNTLKILYSMYKGAYGKAKEGQKKFKEKFEPEGHTDLLGGDFLIDEDGIIKYPYYNQYLGDHLPVNEILRFINNEALKIELSTC